MTQIKVNSVNTTHGNIEFEQINPVVSAFIQQSNEIAKLSEEEFEEYREMFQDVLALRGDLRLFYTTDNELSDAIYDINEPLDALFKALRRIVIDQIHCPKNIEEDSDIHMDENLM